MIQNRTATVCWEEMLKAGWPDTDADIYIPLRAGDMEGLALAYDRYGTTAFSLAVRILGDHGAAEEVVQDVFLRIWRSASSFDPSRGNFRSWLLTMARNRSIDALRGRRRIAEPAEAQLEVADPSADSDPWRAVVGEFERETIRNGLESLPAEQRETIELGFYAGLSHSEIADRLELPLGTVKGRMRLGLEKIAHFLEARGVTER